MSSELMKAIDLAILELTEAAILAGDGVVADRIDVAASILTDLLIENTKEG